MSIMFPQSFSLLAEPRAEKIVWPGLGLVWSGLGLGLGLSSVLMFGSDWANQFQILSLFISMTISIFVG